MAIAPEEIQAAFDAEVARLVEKGLSPELETLARRYYSQKERESMDDDEFCGPHKSFPVKSQEDVHNAASLAGHADNPDAVRACIRRKAKAHGWSLPASWEKGDSDSEKKERSMAAAPAMPASVDGAPHEPMTGRHAHAHPHMDGYSHEHEHEHVNDNVHDHQHSHAHPHHRSVEAGHSHEGETTDQTHEPEESPSQERALPTAKKEDWVRDAPGALTPADLSVYLPITRVDATSRTVTGQATVEKPDAYGTIFGYCPDAWLKWRGNMREQHDPKKAVGKAIEVIPDPEERAIYVTSKVSRGAQDTWLKIEDGVLSCYSASIIPDPEFGPDPAKWPKKEYNGKQYPYLPRYQVAETSYVDNPATPGCNIAIVRADGFVTEVLDFTEEEPVRPEEKPIERAVTRASGAPMSKMHQSIGHTLHAAMSQMQNCGCPDCQAAIRMIDPDNDDDIDLGGYDDPDHDWQSLYNKQSEDMERVVTDLINRALTPAYTRLQGIAGVLARNNALPTNLDGLITSAITRAFETIDAKLAALPTQASLDEVRSALAEVKGQVDRIAEQPQPGGPILNASSLPPRAIEKQLPTDPPLATTPQRSSFGAVYDAIAQLSKSGALDTQDKQVDALTAGFLAQRRR